MTCIHSCYTRDKMQWKESKWLAWNMHKNVKRKNCLMYSKYKKKEKEKKTTHNEKKNTITRAYLI